MNRDSAYDIILRMKDNISGVIVGKDKVIDYILTALIAEGHILMDDVPGTGKTKMAKTLARSVNAEFSRIQFTPDLLPSDVTGLNYYNQKEQEFVFRAGPVFTNILLADEINRATPRTQSALLECMEERQVTIDAVTHKLSRPFFVIATQNPVETSGTFPLPEAQLDRFLMKISMGLPGKEEELSILSRFSNDDPLETLEPVCTAGELAELQQAYKDIYVHPDLMSYAVSIVQATRESAAVRMGVSPRGTLALMRAARAFALIRGRGYVVPEDIKEIAVPVLAHRIIFPAGLNSDEQSRAFIQEILSTTEVPTEDWSR